MDSNCPFCRNELKPHADTCGHCGAYRQMLGQRSGQGVELLVGLGFAWLMFGLGPLAGFVVGIFDLLQGTVDLGSLIGAPILGCGVTFLSWKFGRKLWRELHEVRWFRSN